jgi:hypothetical protein
MSASPSSVASKAIVRLSGDQRGVPAMGPSKLVSACALSPDASATQISLAPLRFDSNARRRPSGEDAALASHKVDGTIGPDVAGSCRFSRQTAKSWPPRENTSAVSSRESAKDVA